MLNINLADVVDNSSSRLLFRLKNIVTIFGSQLHYQMIKNKKNYEHRIVVIGAISICAQLTVFF